MRTICHTGQSRHFLTLASGRDKYQLFIRIAVHIVDADQSLLRNLHVAKICSDLNDRLHAPALKDHLPAIFMSGVNKLLHTIHI